MDKPSKWQKAMVRYYKKSGYIFYMRCDTYGIALDFAIQYERQIELKSFDNFLMFKNEEDLNAAKLMI